MIKSQPLAPSALRPGLEATAERRRDLAASAPRPAAPTPETARRHRTERAARQFAERVAPFVDGAGRRGPDGSFYAVALLRADQSWLAAKCEELGVVAEVAR